LFPPLSEHIFIRTPGSRQRAKGDAFANSLIDLLAVASFFWREDHNRHTDFGRDG
jgi:hypothetical protein